MSLWLLGLVKIFDHLQNKRLQRSHDGTCDTLADPTPTI
jgi:hypothetical protein